ncbi:WD40 repeat domain-containing protein [Kitasatospora sp. NPDC085879]|uniref:WD40 repeat domain-containing protein n=1 Tax=Kitasatospora sp. NPDC085879 TaxID=3154769 RepID=UPI0034282991
MLWQALLSTAMCDVHDDPAPDARQVDDRLTSPSFVVSADPACVLRLSGRASSPEAQLVAAVYRASAALHRTLGPGARRHVLALDAARFGDRELAARFTAVKIEGEPASAWEVQWATGSWVDQRFVCSLAGSDGPSSMASAVVDGRVVAVGAGAQNGTVRVWDLETGVETGDPLTAHGRVCATATAVRDNCPVAVLLSAAPSEGAGSALQVWDLSSREQLCDIRTAPADDVATFEVEGRPMAVTAHGDGTLRTWDLVVGEPVGGPLTGHTERVVGVATAVVDGRPMAVSSSDDLTVRVWDLTTRQQVGEPHAVDVEDTYSWRVTTAMVDGRPVVVSAEGNDVAKIQVWGLLDRQPVSEFVGEPNLCHEISTAVVDGRPVAVTADNETVLMVDLATGSVTGEPMLGHRYDYTHDCRPVERTATAVVNGRPFAITQDEGGRTLVWNLGSGTRLGDPQRGHIADWEVEVLDTTSGRDGRPVVVSVGYNRATVIAWDLETGRRVTEPYDAAGSWVTGGAAAHVDAQPVVLVSDKRGTQLSEVATGRELGRIPHAATCVSAELDGRPVAVTAGDGDAISVWDLATCQHVRSITHGDPGGVKSLAASVVDDRPVIVTGSAQGAVAMWDLATGRQVGDTVNCGAETWGITVAATEQGPLAVVLGKDTTVQAWELLTGRALGGSLTPYSAGEEWTLPVGTVVEGRPCVVTGAGQFEGPSGTLRVWDLLTGQQAGPDLAFPWPVTRLEQAPGGRLLVAFGREIALLTPRRKSA